MGTGRDITPSGNSQIFLYLIGWFITAVFPSSLLNIIPQFSGTINNMGRTRNI